MVRLASLECLHVKLAIFLTCTWGLQCTCIADQLISEADSEGEPIFFFTSKPSYNGSNNKLFDKLPSSRLKTIVLVLQLPPNGWLATVLFL